MSTNQLAEAKARLELLKAHVSRYDAPGTWNYFSEQLTGVIDILAAFEASGPDTAEAPGELDPRMALDTARKMLTYAQSFNGQKFDSMLDSVDRRNLAVALENLEETAAMLLNQASRLYEQSDAGAETCQNCGDLRYPGCKSELQGEPACRFWPARAALATPPLQTPAVPMTLNEFCAEADRIGLTADVFAAQLAGRSEFADCLGKPLQEQDKRDGAPTADEITSLLPCSYYMDPPDGGDVTLLEQLQRMAKAAARYRFLRDDTETNWGICEWSCEDQDGIGYYRDMRPKHVLDAALDAAILAKSQGAGAEALPDMEAGGKTT